MSVGEHEVNVRYLRRAGAEAFKLSSAASVGLTRAVKLSSAASVGLTRAVGVGRGDARESVEAGVGRWARQRGAQAARAQWRLGRTCDRAQPELDGRVGEGGFTSSLPARN